MKILFVIPAIGNVYGGPSKTIIALAQALHDRGHQIDIVTTNANGGSQLEVPLQRWITEDGYRIQYFPYWKLGDYKFSLGFTRWLFQHVRDYDLVQTNAIFSYPLLPAYWACQRDRIPYVVTPHGMLEPWALSYKAGKKRHYYNWLEAPALRQASVIHALATPEAVNIEQLGLNRSIRVVPNGIHRSDFVILPGAEEFLRNFPDTRNKQLILFLGRIDPKKGLDLLAPAFARLHQQFPETHLVIAGPDNTDFQPTAADFFADVGCASAITFTGMLTGSLKYAALAAADVYVAPSYSEGFSLSILEGMAAGLPCVITTGCNFPEAIAAQAAHVVPIEVEAIGDALVECLQNPQAAQAMGQRSRQMVFDHYTWDRVASQMEEVYAGMLDRRSALVTQL
jgi:glycosyltransferase involved in cell wall biosynthesis